MSEGPDDRITGLTFADIYNRIAALITVNAGMLAIAQWAQAGAGSHFRAWIGRTAQARSQADRGGAASDTEDDI